MNPKNIIETHGCQKCTDPSEGLPHVLWHCKKNLVKITHRHDLIVDTLLKASSGSWNLFKKNQPLASSSLRYDLVLVKLKVTDQLTEIPEMQVIKQKKSIKKVKCNIPFSQPHSTSSYSQPPSSPISISHNNRQSLHPRFPVSSNFTNGKFLLWFHLLTFLFVLFQIACKKFLTIGT